MRFRLASPGRVESSPWIAGCPRRRSATGQLEGELRGERQDRAVGDLEAGDEVGLRTLIARHRGASTLSGSQLVGLSVKPGRSRFTRIIPQPERDPVDDLRETDRRPW